MKRRFYIESTPRYSTEAAALLSELKKALNIQTLSKVRLIQVYDLFDLAEKDLDRVRTALIQPVRDQEIDESIMMAELAKMPHFTIEWLPGQYDQRAYSAELAFKVLGISPKTQVATALLYGFNHDLSAEDLQKIQDYLFNPINSRLKDLTLPINESRFIDRREPKKVEKIKDFIHMTDSKLTEFKLQMGLAMEFEDLKHIQDYFKNEENRNPTETELLVLDTYWSDHCRHTTFETALQTIDFTESQFKEQIQQAYEDYLALRRETGITERPETLMDMATIFGRYQRKTGELADMEVSDEVNACSVRINVDVNGVDEPWLLMFKNETHNHPTEIEPFGGANTCVGGAIRDPLSGRAYVYQGMRITGAGNVLEPVEETLPNKIPQRRISKVATQGNSAYANQIGGTTAFAKEYIHPGFVAKRMELGAVVGAVREDYVVREKPVAGDLIILLGAKTGRDGVGAATGSSQVQTVETVETAGTDVQKGCASEERKILRLFRKKEVTTLIKKSNDFGAGGVSVAIGELADGVYVDLDKVPTKYPGLNGTDLAISESQERMAVVVAKENAERFIELAAAESVDAVVVAKVTEDPRLVLEWKGHKIVDIARSFLDTNGIRKTATAKVVDSNLPSPLLQRQNLDDIEKTWQNILSDVNIASQKGMNQSFDSTLGRSTVLLPYGGKCQATPAEASIQKIQVAEGETQTAAILAHGYNPYIGEWSPFHGAAYAVIESLSRLVASGGDPKRARLSFQEYFERLDGVPERFGKPVAALLGSIAAQKAFNVPSIGGKDSMSGTYEEINVPPTLVSFAVVPVKTEDVISPEFKDSGHYIYLLPVKEDVTDRIPYEEIKRNFEVFEKIHRQYKIYAASSVRQGGVAESLAMMSFGNRIGANIENISEHDLFRPQYGAFVITTRQALPESEDYIAIGTTLSEYRFDYGQITILGSTLQAAAEDRFEKIYPIYQKSEGFVPKVEARPLSAVKNHLAVEKPQVLIPVFEGTHSEYDTAKAFEKAGATTNLLPIVMLTEADYLASILKFKEALKLSEIFVLSSGFASTEEPAGTGSTMALFLKRPEIQKAVENFLEKGGLLLGINAGFHALVKTGLLPYGEYRQESELLLTTNQIGEFKAQMVTTEVVNNHSLWFATNSIGEEHHLPFAALEGRVVLTEELYEQLKERGQIATQYVDHKGRATLDLTFNPALSDYAIEAITSPNGQILGKMAHSERYEEGLFLNIPGNKAQTIFENAVAAVTTPKI
ncbi:phosphoribosylformylglycinamidine synthase [Ignatzschineria sp. F8392]|uniref:phosphoribosylformylglycinamidine synthase n=1 Tax=Ignatzschineria sp. F8392 TaxID=1980117 RepID=UPI000B9912CC|nr:phosphoribosylformylglycinamidine synthase [Ignatzschineria sp. F8392]OYQ81858.1 phosphoribosylformylglycinamidine synthase [Ignatzschineria sp. F8392]